nr:hypothetical protein MIMGU_mgv1a012698mg [Ipomoea batatas]
MSYRVGCVEAKSEYNKQDESSKRNNIINDHKDLGEEFINPQQSPGSEDSIPVEKDEIQQLQIDPTVQESGCVDQIHGAPRLRAVDTIVTFCSLILAAKLPVPTPKSIPILISPGLVPKTSLIKKSTANEVLLPTHLSFSLSISKHPVHFVYPLLGFLLERHSKFLHWDPPKGLVYRVWLLIQLGGSSEASPSGQWVTPVDHELLSQVPIIFTVRTNVIIHVLLQFLLHYHTRVAYRVVNLFGPINVDLPLPVLFWGYILPDLLNHKAVDQRVLPNRRCPVLNSFISWQPNLPESNVGRIERSDHFFFQEPFMFQSWNIAIVQLISVLLHLLNC